MNRYSRLGVAAWLSVWGVWLMACSQAADSPLPTAYVVLADQRTAEPVTAIAAEYQRRTEVAVTVQAVAAAELEARFKSKRCDADVVVGMDTKDGDATPVSKLPNAHTVAWKYPSGEAVWAAPLTSKPGAASLVKFLGGGTGHILWSESAAGFTIVGGPIMRKLISGSLIIGPHIRTRLPPCGCCASAAESAQASAWTSAAVPAAWTWNWPSGPN